MVPSPAREFRDLILWQKAHRFVLDTYALTKSLPHFELYGITSQIRRASVSIEANIAEGFKKRTLPEKIRLLNISQGSLEECRYYLILIEDLSYARTESELDLLEEVSKILESYVISIKRKL